MLDAPDVVQERPEGCSHKGNGTGHRHCSTTSHVTQAPTGRRLSPAMVSVLTLHWNVGGEFAADFHDVSLSCCEYSITHSHHKIHKIIFYCCIFAIEKINRTCMKKCWNLWYNETGAVIGLAECRTAIHTPTRPTYSKNAKNILYAEQYYKRTEVAQAHRGSTNRTKFHHCT